MGKGDCPLGRHFKWTHFRAVIVTLWNRDIFPEGYHTMRIMQAHVWCSLALLVALWDVHQVLSLSVDTIDFQFWLWTSTGLCLGISIQYWMIVWWYFPLIIFLFSLEGCNHVSVSPLPTSHWTSDAGGTGTDSRLAKVELFTAHFRQLGQKSFLEKKNKPWHQSWRVILVVELALGEGQWIPQI